MAYVRPPVMVRCLCTLTDCMQGMGPVYGWRPAGGGISGIAGFVRKLARKVECPQVVIGLIL